MSVFVAMVLNKDLHTGRRAREKKPFNTLHKYRSIACNWTYENSFRFANAHAQRSARGSLHCCLIADIPEFSYLFFFLLFFVYLFFCRRHHHRRFRRRRRQYPLVIV